MIKIENVEVMGWEAAIRGMRNPMNSWEKSDSELGCEIVSGSHEFCRECDHSIDIHGNIICDKGNNPDYVIGYNDLDLMTRLRNAGTDHRKFMRMITVYLDITAPLYWWKEFKTYRAGRKFGDDEPDIIDEGYLEYDIEMNSCSTMHKIADKEFTIDDFSHEHLMNDGLFVYPLGGGWRGLSPIDTFKATIGLLNRARKCYLETKDKKYWWQMIQLLPSSYNQRRTVMLNYEVLANIYKSRCNHKLDEWRELCTWIEKLPYSEIITGELDGTDSN